MNIKKMFRNKFTNYILSILYDIYININISDAHKVFCIYRELNKNLKEHFCGIFVPRLFENKLRIIYVSDETQQNMDLCMITFDPKNISVLYY